MEFNNLWKSTFAMSFTYQVMVCMAIYSYLAKVTSDFNRNSYNSLLCMLYAFYVSNAINTITTLGFQWDLNLDCILSVSLSQTLLMFWHHEDSISQQNLKIFNAWSQEPALRMTYNAENYICVWEIVCKMTWKWYFMITASSWVRN